MKHHKHMKEMIKYAYGSVDNQVWVRPKQNEGGEDWRLTIVPLWSDSNFYIVDDAAADIRKAMIDKKDIYYKNNENDKWTKLKYNDRIIEYFIKDIYKQYMIEDKPSLVEWQWLYRGGEFNDGLFNLTGYYTELEVLEEGERAEHWTKFEPSRQIRR